MQSVAKTAILAATLGTAALASTAAPAEKVGTLKPTVVLVHGAFADGSTWSRVIPVLQAKGLKVVAVQNPLTSLAADVAATRRVLAKESGPVVLVGHSYGGVVITEAGQQANVKALVYVAAYAPSEGQSIADLNKDYPTPSGFSHIVADNEGFLTLTEEGVSKHLAQDVEADQTRLMTAVQTPTQSKNFEDKVSVAAWKARPSWYVVSEKDHMLQPDLQRAMAKKIQASIVSLPAGHAPQISRPAEVAEAILAATEAASR
ncbi:MULTISPECIES: alpha/beta fold hydrolase [Ralstonia solanacearum species complex]|uniref:Hydrolases or acyltransferases (Alpha/beta hydrolase superfamily) protein n=1 Tax=Ralstonia solanacearum TaxID=305 RepID=A0A0S4VUI0_RALSL|nr:alpha/beta hydrolase [Ralstonia pseudosolanacearum]CUV26376.1 Hydrolases or acyltransferases (Alpha/beta hydrolase superfamily) protein [Ralstonia solanacearum]MCL1618931.1 alpha/beta hydrolase [Ralstonia pseudosolanacearum CaRs-Mep]MCQ4681616.1 alpha/beta hydrolase [Ralstonia pseudosolanacearum]CUV37056.1 Hydrolases or acyltransferases (Alpha/beta hydrolase superfamily) protein [Ralstonia solanacearum]CUV38174.1 Hydrolases or acyltransferases (Alpha/beta hydrolase superfamily) protein [Ral